MSSATLVLNADFRPINVVGLADAIGYLVAGEARLLETYDRPVRHGRGEVYCNWPAVVVLNHYIPNPVMPVALRRKNLLARDNFQCAYCGVQPKLPNGAPDVTQLTWDHVIPRAHAVDGKVTTKTGQRVWVTSWANLVCSCESCNQRKQDRTPDEAGMPLRFHKPRRPTLSDALRIAVLRRHAPKVDDPGTPLEWQGYWDVKLDGC